MATVTTYISRLRNRLGDSSTTGPFTTARLTDFCNDGLKDIARRLRPWLLPELNVVDTGDITTDGTVSYVSLTTDYSQIVSMTVYNLTNEDDELILVQDGEGYKQRSRRNVFYRPGNKQMFGHMELGRIYIEPYKDGFKFKLRYVQTPTFVSAGDEIPIGERWEDILLDYGEYLSRRLEHRDQEAESAFQKYETKLERANQVESS